MDKIVRSIHIALLSRPCHPLPPGLEKLIWRAVDKIETGNNPTEPLDPWDINANKMEHSLDWSIEEGIQYLNIRIQGSNLVITVYILILQLYCPYNPNL